MKDQELKKLKRAQLLEIMVAQSKEIERLQEELARTKKELENKKIAIENAGTLAEAALKLTHIFEAADEAAKIYLDNVKAATEDEPVTKEQETGKDEAV